VTTAGVDNSDGAMQAGERLQLQGNGLDNQRARCWVASWTSIPAASGWTTAPARWVRRRAR
jgi:adhesin HecA-like repeat protein